MASEFPSIFISYSRQETPFVNQLSARLENAGVPIWLDYKSLIPAHPWLGQVESGIASAEVFVLVVSRESLASRYVELEWKRALEFGKRIVLVIYQAAPLPQGLRSCEWVDLRVDFNGGVKKLLGLLQNPQPPVAPAPQSGERAPWQVWVAISLSLSLIPVAFFAAWTLVLPYLLVPLPWQIYHRRFNFSQVRFALLSLPLFVFVSGSLVSRLFAGTDENTFNSIFTIMLLASLSLNFILLGMLSSRVLERWGRPESAPVRFAHPLDPRLKEIRPVIYAIDYAVEDGRYAEAIDVALKEAGHRPAAEGEIAEASFVLISAYKKTTRFDPETQAVYPVLLQAIKDIDPALSHIQWIDFRGGLRNLHRLAQLLPDPQRLLAALAIAPAGSQTVHPPAVAFLMGYAVVSGVLTGGSLLVVLLELMGKAISQGLTLKGLIPVGASIVNGGFLALVIFWVVIALGQRRGGAAAIYPILVMYLFQTLNVFLLAVRENTLFGAENLTPGVLASLYNLLVFLGGGILAAIYAVIRWQDVWHWLPLRPAGGIHAFERLFLLYTPPKIGTWVLHMLFHALFLMAYFGLYFILETAFGENIGYFTCVCAPIWLIAVAVNLWARHLGHDL